MLPIFGNSLSTKRRPLSVSTTLYLRRSFGSRLLFSKPRFSALGFQLREPAQARSRPRHAFQRSRSGGQGTVKSAPPLPADGPVAAISRRRMIAAGVGASPPRRFSFDICGDAVNTASVMEAHCLPGRVNICKSCRVC
jgi:hypothetical protein